MARGYHVGQLQSVMHYHVGQLQSVMHYHVGQLQSTMHVMLTAYASNSRPRPVVLLLTCPGRTAAITLLAAVSLSCKEALGGMNSGSG